MRKVEIFITKPKISLDAWENVFSKADQLFTLENDELVNNSRSVELVGARGAFKNPNDLAHNKFENVPTALLNALKHGRAGEGLIIQNSEIDQCFTLDGLLAAPAKLSSFIYVAEFGAVLLITMVETKKADEAYDPACMYECFTQTLKQNSAGINQEYNQSVEEILNVKVDADFQNSFSYQLSFSFSGTETSKHERQLHIAEDGLYENQTNILKLATVACNDAFLGWSKSTFSFNDINDYNFVHLVSPFLAIDGLYAVTTLQFQSVYDELSRPYKEDTSKIEAETLRLERILARAERLALFDNNYSTLFKPWQAQIYIQLRDKWSMQNAMDGLRKLISLRLQDLKSTQSRMSLKLEKRRNYVLYFIAIIDVLGLLGVLASYIEVSTAVDGNVHVAALWLGRHSLWIIAFLVILSLGFFFRPSKLK